MSVVIAGLEPSDVVIRIRDLGLMAAGDGACERFEAELADYPVVREYGATPWEAAYRLVAMHRALLERRWSVWR
jgi:hypothetical protein